MKMRLCVCVCARTTYALCIRESMPTVHTASSPPLGANGVSGAARAVELSTVDADVGKHAVSLLFVSVFRSVCQR